MIIQVLAYDPDYFVANALVFSEFQIDRQAPLVRLQSIAWLAWREQQMRNNMPHIRVFATGNNTLFAQRVLSSPLVAAPGTFTKVISASGVAKVNSLYPAQDNPIVEVDVTGFDISNPVDTYLSAVPFVG